MKKLPQAVHELPGHNRRHGIAKLGRGHAFPLVVLVPLIVVEDAGDLLFGGAAAQADELGGDHRCQDAGLLGVAGQGQEELGFAELLVHAHGHAPLRKEVRLGARQIPQSSEHPARVFLVPAGQLRVKLALQADGDVA